VIPKFDCFDDLPPEYVLGYSVPSQYGSTPLPPEMFAGRSVHLLGGSWIKQREHLDVLGDDVISLDANSIGLSARYGMVEGGAITRSINAYVGRDGPEAERLPNTFYISLALSFSLIAEQLCQYYGGKAPDAAADMAEAEALAAEGFAAEQEVLLA
jgi:hypothetical protein